MGISKLKIPRVCEHCSKPFEAKKLLPLVFAQFLVQIMLGKNVKKRKRAKGKRDFVEKVCT